MTPGLRPGLHLRRRYAAVGAAPESGQIPHFLRQNKL